MFIQKRFGFLFLFFFFHPFIHSLFNFSLSLWKNISIRYVCPSVRLFVCLFIDTTIVMVEFFFLVCSFEYIQQTYGWHTNRQTDKCGDFFFWNEFATLKYRSEEKKNFFFVCWLWRFTSIWPCFCSEFFFCVFVEFSFAVHF